ncbi:MAG TPA: shikimate dehydrogenase [Opitutaceae bacterium]|nr:shikimate dehydrogenase [Opitutaceae bacterium]
MLGHPIGHSISPQMHNAALAELARGDARFAGWRYFPFDVEPGRLPEALVLLRERRFRGVNLTVPHKVLAVGLVPDLDPVAREAGAVNTLVQHRSGWRGFNTDGHGLAAGILEDLGLGLRGAPVVLLGAGGAARGAAVECLRAGCAALWIMNRTWANLDTLLKHLAPLAGKVPVGAMAPGRAAAGLQPGAIVINATSAGLRAGDSAPADLAALPGIAAVYDMIYNPPETRLLAQARALGLPHANGLGMLVHQGAKALEIWTGIPSSSTAPAMRAAAAKALGY